MKLTFEEVLDELAAWELEKKQAERKLQRWIATAAWSDEICAEVDWLNLVIEEADAAIVHYTECLRD